MLKYDHLPTRFLRAGEDGMDFLYLLVFCRHLIFFLGAICQCHYVHVIGKENEKKVNK